MKEYNEYMDTITADANLYEKITDKSFSTRNETRERIKKQSVRKAILIAAIITVSLGFTATAYAVVSQLIEVADSGSGHVYVISDEHFVKYPDEAWRDFDSGVREHRLEGTVTVEHYNDRYINTTAASLEEAFVYIGSEFNIPEGFGLTPSNINLHEDLYLGIKRVNISMEPDYNAISDSGHVSGYWIDFTVSTIPDNDEYEVIVGMPGTIDEVIINDITIHRLTVSGESLGVEDYPYNFIKIMWQHNGLAYDIFCNDIYWSLEDLEIIAAIVLP